MPTTLQLLQDYPLGTLEVEVFEHSIIENELGPATLSIGRGKVCALLSHTAREPTAWVDLGYDERWLPVSQLMPYLKSFDQLCTPLPDKTVPAVEVAKIVTTGSCSTRTVTFTTTYIGSGWVVDFSNGYFVRIDDTWDMIVGLQHAGKQLPVDLKNAFAAADYLRFLHFALPIAGTPLVEGQDYIRKD